MNKTTYRKCKDHEISKIIDVADNAFSPNRKAGFSFKTSVPQVYVNKTIDYSSSHFIAEENGKFVAVAGNLIDEIQIDNENVGCFNVGAGYETHPYKCGTQPTHHGLT